MKSKHKYAIEVKISLNMKYLAESTVRPPAATLF